MREITEYLEKHRGDFENSLCELLRIPSVSADPAFHPHCAKAADWVAGQFREMGLATELIPTCGQPLVFAQSENIAGAPTVLVYGHYDVQPPDPLDQWISPPFEPTKRNGNLYARGATDDKGQMFTHVASAKAWLKTRGKLKTIARMDVDVTQWISQSPANLDEVVSRLEKIRPDDVCTIVYTSGTTGDPKGAELAHRNLVDTTRAVIKVHPLSEADYTLSWLPFSHVFERINGTFTVLMFGGQMWLSNVDRLADDLVGVEPTILLSVPRVYEKMHARVMDRVREAPAIRQRLFT